MKKEKILLTLLICGALGLSACGTKTDTKADAKVLADKTNTEASADKTQTAEILRYRDVFGKEYETTINPSVPENVYVDEKFNHNGDRLTYEDDTYTSRIGIDVSHHQGNIDWNKVKAAGYDFAFIRIGYRGYGAEGKINADREFDRNIVNAKKAGLDVGVYFFAQAINEDEAREEANFVIEKLKNYTLDLPVIYDPESILDDVARTDNVTAEQFTKNTIAFCEAIKAAGYEPGVYANMLWEVFSLDMASLTAYPFWYADYEALPQTPYRFQYWQYSNKGNVPGVQGECDLNIELIPK